MCNSLKTAKDNWKHSTVRLWKVMDSLKSSTAKIYMYMKMATSSSPDVPKVRNATWAI